MVGYAAALYIRLSKEDDGTSESESVANQRSLLREFCAKHRIYVYDEYVDDGYSGGNFDRPAFTRMISDIEAKNVNMVITKDMSRFGRDYIQTGHDMERYFPEKSVRYISLLDGIDTGLELSANDITPFRAIINDLYAKDISKKIKSVKRDKQRKGLFIGWKPSYGYKSSPDNSNVLMVDDEAAAVVRDIFEMALTGMSCRQIAVRLNDKGVQTPAQYSNLKTARKGPYSGLWSSERVTFILKNRVYVGDMVQRRMEKVSYKSEKCRRLPESEWAIVENTHEPIIDRGTFERAGLMIESRKKTRLRTYDYLLKGLIYCKECQTPLGVVNRPLVGQDTTLYFLCRTYQRFTKNSACTSHCIKVDKVTDAVVDHIRAICAEYLDKKTGNEVTKSVVEELADDSKAEVEIKRLEQDISRITAKMDKLYDDRLTGIVEDDDFMRVYSQMKAQRSDMQERLDKLNIFSDEEPIFDQSIDELIEVFISSADTSRELLCSLVERVELSQERELSIRFRYAPEEVVCLK
jgi:DNA invertase Pin-like site-specific DNA recombinase